MKLSRRQKRILKRKLKRIAGDVVAVIVGAGMFVGLFVAWANEPMPDWSEYIEENHIGMVREWRHFDWRWDERLWLRVHAFPVDCCHYFVQLLSLYFDGRWQVYQSCQSVQQFDVSRSA